MGMGVSVREAIAKRAAQEIKDGMVVNLGIGIPTLVANYIPSNSNVMFHAENGVLGTGPAPIKGEEDPNLCNAGGIPITIVPGASYFDSTIAFGIIRRGLLDITILGAFEVSENGDLANWIVPGKIVSGMGGAVDLAQKAKKVIVLMNHTDKHGNPKIVPKCMLPLTAEQCVDLIITDMAVIEVTDQGLQLIEVKEPYTVEDVINATGAALHVADFVK
ncbi:3-oxoacid CoA-transferase subunit B [Siminovitchia sp. FSL H7-0308]|uniref:Acetate CoA/acetoacetate CoA-transferase beta subunit n=1 Tax=Siminovitchia thermophila TaxID=1245522 RepID=A0ABS2R7B6_9BACI|nr:3-oxoacid CoA-transferase subunit B [Siminovitchia thermophila]MBM7715029.1 acetate CoA/acetoacetate CoA-transferase beta subunit [Siminovitchia thermophila]ONK22390.1 acyl CoA:acetate/3-ketoacid CoA transferase subunit beta [Bacillus sp. VT-16-64]